MIYENPALTDRQAALDHARAQLDPDRYDAAHATGIAMTYEQIIEYTLGELDRLLAESNSSKGECTRFVG